MKMITVLHDFEGYPDGKKRREFVAGQEVEVPVSFADLVVGKGHAKPVEGAKTDAPVKKETAK